MSHNIRTCDALQCAWENVKDTGYVSASLTTIEAEVEYYISGGLAQCTCESRVVIDADEARLFSEMCANALCKENSSLRNLGIDEVTGLRMYRAAQRFHADLLAEYGITIAHITQELRNEW